jgi:NAD(P)-dependent dehydrogenase (short-subunit alcohol dehydrogenase family)
LKVAFVTGGSGGIGRATAVELARKGWAIAVGYRNSETGAKETLDAVAEVGSNGTTVQIDVADEASVIEAFRAAAEALGTINGLVNNAGMTRDGTFRIRDGKIAEPLVNLRFTVAVPDFLHDVLGLTSRAALVNSQNFYGERYPYGVLTPAIASERFAVTGIGSKPGI